MSARMLIPLIAAMTASVPVVSATVYQIAPGDNLQAAVNALAPGDVLLLEGGTYLLSSRFSIQKTGSASAPITIRPAPGATPHITYVDASQNVINVENSAHVRLIGLEVSGGSHGIRILDSDDITVDRCHIHDTADVGLSANVPGGTYERLRLSRNHIHHTGGTAEGMYLGCNSNGCRLLSSVIEGNYIHHTNSPGVTQGDGIELKEGSADNVIANNVIHDTGYPCIITYSAVGNGGPNTIEGNLLWNCGDHAIQSAADARIRNNIVLGAASDGIRCQPHQAGTPANLEITHNTVLAPANNTIRVSSITGSVVIANNAVYAALGNAIRVDGDLSDVTVAGNRGEGTTVGVGSGFDGGGSLGADLVDASYSGALPQDVFPANGSGLVGAADPSWRAGEDFNLAPRGSADDIGAYRAAGGGNPGWELTAGFKPSRWVFDDGFELGSTADWSATTPP
ncbi:MAG: right-handed parallel beta-helix repeat-containing protein [Candidatus Sulfomarinibacteraceae bacterium]